MAENKNKTSIRMEIISKIKSPLGLLGLIVLVTEGILMTLAFKATGTDFTLLVIGMLLLLGGIVFVVYKSFINPDVNTETDEIIQQTKYDVFLASPMASYDTDQAYKKDREGVLKLITSLRKECDFKSIIYAGHHIETMDEFDVPDLSIIDNMEALNESKYFVMVFPMKMVSSVLIEAGVALCQSKPSIFFVRKKDELPFLLRQAEQAFSFIKIYECKSIDDICKLISKHRLNLLPNKT